MDDCVTLVGTILFQRTLSCAIAFDGITYEGKQQFQFVPKRHISGVDYNDSNLTDIDIRVNKWYYNQHIKWRYYGDKRPTTPNTS